MKIYRDQNTILETLVSKKGIVKVILDTDTYNEIDDQFALVQMLFSKKRMDVLSINAAPFSMNNRSDDPQKGMELSYDEIFRLLEKINFKKNNFVFKGSTKYVGFEKKPINSPAADNIIETALKCSANDPLYVIAIGAITNVASAILKDITSNPTVSIQCFPGYVKTFASPTEISPLIILTSCGIIFPSESL